MKLVFLGGYPVVFSPRADGFGGGGGGGGGRKSVFFLLEVVSRSDRGGGGGGGGSLGGEGGGEGRLGHQSRQPRPIDDRGGGKEEEWVSRKRGFFAACMLDEEDVKICWV